jgi:hypothetical protein
VLVCLIAFWHVLKRDADPTRSLHHPKLPQKAIAGAPPLNRMSYPSKCRTCRRAVVRSMSLLKQSEHHRPFHNDDRQQNYSARKEAEALFRPKHQSVEPSLPVDPSPAGAPARKPRVLSASLSPVTSMVIEAAISSKPQTKPPVSISQLARAHREHLKGTRAAIFRQQDELQEKLHAIDSELRAIDAYESAKKL